MVKKVISSFLLALCFLFSGITVNADSTTGSYGLNNINSGVFADVPVATVVSNVIKVIMGLSATVMLIVIIIAGFNYLTSGGDAAKTKKAIDKIKNAAIGIILIVSAYSLSQFIINNITFIAK